MALPQLTDEQIRTWTRAQKDRWWFENVYRGDMPQLTLRSALTGFLLGGILAATNLYIGGKTGITTGVGLTSVILAFAFYRALARSGFAQDFTILENNCTQSIATAAGYMTSPLISALAAYMIVTGKIIPWWHLLAWMLVVAVPVLAVLGAAVSHAFFGVPWFLAFISFPLIFVLAVICTNSMALTSWTPTGSLAKITQFTMAAFDRTNPASNLIPGGMTAEISANAANLLSDIKPGYMLGAKPRQQAIGHVIGIFAGALVAVPLFYLLFLPPAKDGLRSASTIVSDQFAMPAAVQWRGVADLIAHGLKSLPVSAVAAMIVAAVCAAAIELARIATKGRFPLSAVSIGLGVVLPPEYVLTMWLGALLFWWQGRRNPVPGTPGNVFWVEGCEPICAGLIAGWALTGIANSVINVLFY